MPEAHYHYHHQKITAVIRFCILCVSICAIKSSITKQHVLSQEQWLLLQTLMHIICLDVPVDLIWFYQSLNFPKQEERVLIWRSSPWLPLAGGSVPPVSPRPALHTPHQKHRAPGPWRQTNICYFIMIELILSWRLWQHMVNKSRCREIFMYWQEKYLRLGLGTRKINWQTRNKWKIEIH